MKKLVISVILAALSIGMIGCAGKTTNPSTPATPSTGPVQFVAYAEGAIAAGETALTLIHGLSASDLQLGQIALSDLGQGIACVAKVGASTEPAISKISDTTACLAGLTIPSQASPQLTSILKGAFQAVQAFLMAYQAQTQAQQAATVAAITPAATQAVVTRANALVKKN